MPRMLLVPRSRGALSGVLLVLLGAWGALIPFVGPYFGYAYTPASAWTYTSGRLWLSVLPGVAALIGGAVLLISTLRPVALAGAALAALAGAWFAVNATLATAWAAIPDPGSPVGGALMRSMEQLGFFTGLGVVIVAVAAVAFGRLSVVGLRDARLSAKRETATEARVPVAHVAGPNGTTVPGSRSPAE